MRPSDAPPRRLKTLVRSSGDLATLGDFAPHACPRPASSQWQSPVVGPDGNPGPPEPVLARHNLRRRIRPAWVIPPRPSLKLCPTSGSPLEAPLIGQDMRSIRAPGKASIAMREYFWIFLAFPGRGAARSAAPQSR